MTNKNAESTQPAAAQEAVAWSKTKPTVEGAYYVRGFNLFQPAQYEALVQVRTHHFDGEPAPELVCNIHESTSNEDMDDWSPMVEMSDDFEWLGPLHGAPVAASPVVAYMIDGRVEQGLTFDKAAAESMANMNCGTVRPLVFADNTPAAPGIDLPAMPMTTDREPDDSMPDGYFESNLDWARRPENADALDWFIENHAAIRQLIDASPKGDDCETCNGRGIFDTNGNGPWDRYACGNKGNPKGAAPEFQVPAGWALVPDRMQLTPENMELLADTLRGADEDEPWCGGVLWIGQTTGDDGEPTYYGLNVGNVECLEEGSINIVEFAPLPQDSLKGDSDAPTIPEPHQECYSDNDGDSWYDHPADSMLVDGLSVGDTYTLSVSHYSVGRTYRVIKAPDETSDDYEVEPVQATSAEVGS